LVVAESPDSKGYLRLVAELSIPYGQVSQKQVYWKI